MAMKNCSKEIKFSGIEMTYSSLIWGYPVPKLILLGCLLAPPTLNVKNSESTIHFHSAVCC